MQLRQPVDRFGQKRRHQVIEFVPGGIETGIAQSKVGGDIHNLASLLKQPRHQLHGFAAWKRHDYHVGVAPDALCVHGNHLPVHKLP